MYTQKRGEWTPTWAEILSRPSGHLLRVPQFAAGLRWWRAATDGEVIMRRRLGDLRVALLSVSGVEGGVVIVVGGPGALEIPQADDLLDSGHPSRRAITDPWGNTLTIGRHLLGAPVS